MGVDTNVLVRYIIHDDALQGRCVDSLVERAAEAGERLFVDDVVLCEAVWVLRSGYGLEHDTIAQVLDDLLETALFDFEDRNLLRHALDAYRNGNGGFADYLIGL